MSDLSPAAQSVKDAVLATYADNVPKDDSLWALERPSTVAALRAAAYETADLQIPRSYAGDSYHIYNKGLHAAAEHLRAIAGELESP
jgi:hypothetical protein